jgi:uncharacterized protein YjbI with pentapeptide repeats
MRNLRHGSRTWLLSVLVVGLGLFGVLAAFGGGAAWRIPGLAVLQRQPLWGVLLVLGVFLLGLWALPKWQTAGVADVRDRLALETEARKTLALILTGGLLLVGLYLIWGTLQETRRLLEHSQYLAPARPAAQLGERLLRATEQLGAMHIGGHEKHLEVRLSGIYALERLAQEFPHEYWPVMEVLTAYARANPSTGSAPPVDLEAVLTVLKRRGRAYGRGEDRPLNLRAVGWHGMSLEEIDLSHAILAQADLRAVNFARASLRRANLRGARLSGATLTGAIFEGADLQGADLHEANLRGAVFAGANLSGADLSGVDLTQAALAGASLQGARLHGTSLQGADLRGIALAGAALHAADLREANLAEANLAGNTLSSATLTGAVLTGADLHAANLLKANLQEANLAGANLRGANLQEANLARAALHAANLRDALLVDVKNLSQEQFNTACTDDRRPRWPFNLTWPSGLQPSSALQETCKPWGAKP